MKIRSTTLKLLCTFLLSAGTAAFGQSTFIWTGSADGTNLANAGNWNPNGLASGATQDTCLWDGTVAGPLMLNYDGSGFGNSGFGTSGIFFELGPNMNSSVQVYSVGPDRSPAIGLYSIQNSSTSGSFIYGDTSGVNVLCTMRPAGAIHPMINNSTTPNIINPSLEFQAGGGNGFEYDFSGTGNWIVNNYLVPDNTPFSAMIVEEDGPGTLFWGAGATNHYNPNRQLDNLTITGGAVVMTSAFPLNSGQMKIAAIANATSLTYSPVPSADPTLTNDTWNGVISGAGTLIVNGGTLTLGGQSTYTGNTVLSNGEAIVNAPENAGNFGPLGVTNIISFDGGILGYTANNSFDYSSRFSTAANQQYQIDTGGAFVAFATPLSSSGGSLNKIGAGVLTLTGASSYSGPTVVNGGRLTFQGAKSGTGDITVADGSELGVFNTGTQVSPSTLTLGSSGGCILDFNAVSSTTTAPLNAGTLASTGTVVINVNSGSFIVGQSYPLLSWTGGNAPAVVLGILNGFIGNLTINGNTVTLNIVATAFSWTGAATPVWDLTGIDWLQNGGATVITNNAPAIFDDTSTVTNITMGTLASPTVATFNNNTNAYTLTSSGANNLGGNANLFMAGSGTLTLSGGANTYAGVTTLGGGTIIVSVLANGGSASDLGGAANFASNIVFNSGILQYLGSGTAIDRLFTLNSFGGTIDNEGTGTLSLTNLGVIGETGGGARGLTWITTNATGDLFASALRDGSGATSLTKLGTGTLTLTGTNSYSGLTTVGNGLLLVGNGGGTGSLGIGSAVMNTTNTAIIFNRTNTVTVFGAVSGLGAVTNNGTGTVILAGNNSYSGPTVINSGTVQIGSGAGTGQLSPNNAVTINGNSTFAFNSKGNYQMVNGSVSGTGNVTVSGGGAFQMLDANTYTGITTVNAGGVLWLCSGNTGTTETTGVTNNGLLVLARYDVGIFGVTNDITGSGRVLVTPVNGNTGDQTLLGTNNNWTGGTFINGDTLIIGDNANAGLGTITGNVVVSNNTALATFGPFIQGTLQFNRPDAYSFAGSITGNGALFQTGAGMMTLTGVTNSYSGGTSISNGVLVIAGGGSGSGVGTGTILIDTTDSATTSLIFSNSATVNVPGRVSGAGTIVMGGSGVTTLSGVNTNQTGSVTVSNGVLAIANSAGADVDVDGGIFAAGGYKSASAIIIQGNLNVNAGAVSMALNKALVQSNSFVDMTNVNTSTAGTITWNASVPLQVINCGPTLVAGDKFVLFSAPVPGGDALTVTPLGNFTLQNNLGDDGSVTVTSVAQPPAPKLNKIKLNGTSVTITATNNFGPGGSWDLVGTNNLKAPLSTWPVVASGYFDGNGNLNTSITVSNKAQFFDLRAP